MEHFSKPEDIVSIELLEKEVEKVFLLADKGLVRMVVSTVIANRMLLDPVWLLLVAPPSSGKTEMIMGVSGLDFVFPISDLTVNTFASGQKKVGKETSLLLKINNGLMAFKDFTSILSKPKEARAEILKQLREIYDGEYVKRTGTGDDITWKGKVGVIAGCTEVIYRYLEELSAMGDRFIMYNIEQPNRLEVARRSMDNAINMQDKRDHIKQCFTFFINYVIAKLSKEEIHLDESVRLEILRVADFATRVRSAVMTDFKSGLVDFVPAPEMPMRVTAQLFTLASAFIAIDKANPFLKVNRPTFDGQLSEFQKKLLFKCAFDSIPRTRRDALVPLAMYKDGVSTAGLATLLELPTPSVGKYLAQVNALGICSRMKKGGPQGDIWKLKDQYRSILVDVYGIVAKEGQLLSEDVDDDDFDSISLDMPNEESSLDAQV